MNFDDSQKKKESKSHENNDNLKNLNDINNSKKRVKLDDTINQSLKLK